MTHDDAMKLIAQARATPPAISLAILADALEAVMLERIDILATCSRKIDEQRAIAAAKDQQIAVVETEKSAQIAAKDQQISALEADLATLGTKPEAAALRKAKRIAELQDIFAAAGRELQELKAEPAPTDAGDGK